MVGNVALDGLVGLIPFAGDAFDAVFKANIRNMRILRDYLAHTDPDLFKDAAGPARPGQGPGQKPVHDGVIDAEYRVVRGER